MRQMLLYHVSWIYTTLVDKVLEEFVCQISSMNFCFQTI